MTIKELYDKLCTPEFQNVAEGSLAYNFYIYQYPADKEYEWRNNIQDFCEKLSRPVTYVDVLALNVFEEFCHFMQENRLGPDSMLDANLQDEADYPEEVRRSLEDVAGSEAFYAYLNKRIHAFAKEQGSENLHPYVFVYGIGSMFPYLRANAFLTNYEKFNIVSDYKIILFYPGTSSANSYHLFGKLNDTHAYRATLLNLQ